MKKLLTLVALIAVVAFAGTASAQAEPGDVGIFFDAAGTLTSGALLPSVPFNLYVVGFDVPGDIFGYEMSLQTTLMPGMFFVLSAVVEPAATATNFGAPDNWIVGTGVCYPAQGAALIGTIQMLAFAPGPDENFCLGPSTPSSFTPAVPGYVTCIDATDLRLFGVAENGEGRYPDGCAVGNPTLAPPVANDNESWGSLKASFE